MLVKRFLLALICVSAICGTAFGSVGIKTNTSGKLLDLNGNSLVIVDGQPQKIHSVEFEKDGDGVSRMVISYVSGENILKVTYILTRQDGPGPDPKPDPDPDPNPDPNPPVSLSAVVVEESKERTPETAIVTGSEKVRAMFQGGFRVVDPLVNEKQVTVPDDVKPWVELAIPERKNWPYFIILDEKKKPRWKGTLPKTISAMDKVVEEVKKGGKP